MTATHCDIETGMIYGAKQGTAKWYHEEAHLKFNESEKGSTLHLYQKYLLHSWMALFTAYPSFGSWSYYLSILGLFFYFSIEIYEELWCNKYAKQKLKEKEAQNGETNTGKTD